MTTIETIKKAIQDHITEDEANNKIYNDLFNALKKHEGQVISKRIATSVQKVLPQYDIRYVDTYSWWELRVKSKGAPCKDEKNFRLGYHGSPVFRLVSGDEHASSGGQYTERGFNYYNAWAGRAAIERIADNRKALKSVKLQKFADLHDQIENAKKQIESLDLDYPAQFAVNNALKGEV